MNALRRGELYSTNTVDVRPLSKSPAEETFVLEPTIDIPTPTGEAVAPTVDFIMPQPPTSPNERATRILSEGEMLHHLEYLGDQLVDPKNPYDLTVIADEIDNGKRGELTKYEKQTEISAQKILGEPVPFPPGLEVREGRIVQFPAELQLGSIVYELKKVLGQGAQGVAILAYPKPPGQEIEPTATRTPKSHPVVIKLSLVASPQIQDNRFNTYREILALNEPSRLRDNKASLIHAQAFEKKEQKELVYAMAMEFAEGGTFDRWLERQIENPDFSIENMLSMLMTVRAWSIELEEKLQKGFSHRDVKPANLNRDPHHPWQSRVLDWGMARKQHAVEHSPNGMIVGTLAYMSPAKLMGNGKQADPYALGLILGEATGLMKIPPIVSAEALAAGKYRKKEGVNAVLYTDVMSAIRYGKFIQCPTMDSTTYDSVLAPPGSVASAEEMKKYKYKPDQFKYSPMRDAAFLAYELVQPGANYMEYNVDRFGNDYREIIQRLDDCIRRMQILREAEQTQKAIEFYIQSRSGFRRADDPLAMLSQTLSNGLQSEQYDVLRAALREAYRYFVEMPVEERIKMPAAEKQTVAAFSSAYAGVLMQLRMLSRLPKLESQPQIIHSLEQELREAHSSAESGNLSNGFRVLSSIEQRIEQVENKLMQQIAL